jgi:hypothetical protein
MWDKEEILYHLNYMLQCLTLKEVGALKSVIVMLNARHFQYAVNKENGEINLKFDFSGSSKADQLVLTYCPGPDAFRMTWNKKAASGEYILVQEYADVYFEEMRENFNNITGLETHAPKIFMATPNISMMHVGS